MKKSEKIFFCIFIIFLFILLFFSSFFDFQISNFFSDLNFGEYYSNNFFAICVETFGEFPLFFCMCFSFAIFFANSKFLKVFWQKFFLQFVFSLLLFLAIFLYLIRTKNFLQNYYSWTDAIIIKFFIIIFSFFFTFLILFLINKLNNNKIKKLLKFAVIVFVVCVASVVCAKIFKNVVYSRARFRTMNFLGDYSLFSNWWEWGIVQNNFQNLPYDAFKSFPSGHTMSASLAFVFTFLPNFLILKKHQVVLCFVLPVVVTGIVAFGRIVAGAHFLSDVVFATILVVFVILLTNYLFNTKRH